MTGEITCVSYDGKTTLLIEGQDSSVSGVMTQSNPPAVEAVAMDNVNGVSLGYTEGSQGSARATKNGSTYTITGSAPAVVGNDAVTKNFQISVTCP